MSSISWTEYLSSFVDNIRELYRIELSRDGLNLEDIEHLTNPDVKRQAFSKPCQITVFEFPLLSRALWIVRCENNKPDKEFEVVEPIEKSLKDFVKTHKKYKEYHSAIEFAGIEERFFHMYGSPMLLFDVNYSGFLFLSNPKEKSSYDLALEVFNKRRMFVFRALQRLRVERSTSTILSEVKKVKANPAVLRELKSIQDSMGKLTKIDEHEQKLISMEDDLIGVRRLLGTETFGEWKILLSEMDKMNTRIDALYNIRSAYNKVLSQQNDFMKQQAKVMEQQSSVIKWIKWATILLPIAVILVPIIEVISIFVRHSLGIP